MKGSTHCEVNKMQRTLIIVILVVVLAGCHFSYQPQKEQNIKVQIATSVITQADFNQEKLSSITFNPFKNGSRVQFSKDGKYSIFKINRTKLSSQPEALLVMHKYIRQVILSDDSFAQIKSLQRGVVNKNQAYSNNIIAFNLQAKNKQLYVLIKNKSPTRVAFFLENQAKLKAYDTKLGYSFVSLYSIIWLYMKSSG